ncbi:MAG: hypothetical protein LQ349_004489 [Xanthoria aureola]|nr:MAG: hypothetical protein LQ349_004489 [Xanthoria aureola]
MSGRRASNNRIRGPQSALTDFLAANNISAAQISADYERRRREAHQQAEQEAVANGTALEQEVAEDQQPDEREETALQKKKRKRAEDKAREKIKQTKNSKKQKKNKKGAPEDDGDDGDLAFDMYTKSKPLPGQLDNCEKCEKRFTVTPYSKTGPAGGLLCKKCSEEQESQKKKDAKVPAKKHPGPREKRRQTESSKLDGIILNGALSLQDLCIRTIASNIHEVEEFGDLPQQSIQALGYILSKKRVITSRTLPLFLRPNSEILEITDSGALEVEDYIKIFSFSPRIASLSLKQAGQFKDEVLDYMMERDIPIKHLKLYAANLVSDGKWIEFFATCGQRLESLQLRDLDYSMDDNTFMHLVRSCPHLKRLKMKKCWRLSEPALGAIQELKELEHLSLQFKLPTSSQSLVDLITAVGSGLRTLSLEDFHDADNSVLKAVNTHCSQLQKLRFTENDLCTDTGFTELFTNWSNPPLTFVDFTGSRSIDYNNPDGTDEAVGLGTAGFEALMAHSGSTLTTLMIPSCRHIEREGLANVFDGAKQYPALKTADISFVKRTDTPIVAGIFKSCPQIMKLTAFGCFSVSDVTVPKGVALIGIPNAQDSIVQEGGYDFDSISAGFGLM